MPYHLEHIAHWQALRISSNGKNSSTVYHRYLDFMEQIPERVQETDYSVLIPESYLDGWLSRFREITTMTQTIASIKGEEKAIVPEITCELEHLDTMRMQPFPFQQIGIAFLLSVKRGILGDEVGLGKTPQALGAAHELLASGKAKKILVVCPASLKYQWASEIEKFTGYTSIVIDGSKKKREKQYIEWQESLVDFCVSGYESIRSDIDLVKTLGIDVIVLKFVEALYSNV